MKPRLFLLLSVAFNAALLAAVVALAGLPRFVEDSAPPVRVVLKRLVRVAPATAPATPATVVRDSITSASGAAAVSFHWSQVESEDYRRYMANLRTLSCPEQTVRDIIRADVQSLFAARLSALVRPLQPRYWEILAKGDKHNEVLEGAVKQVEALNKERKEMLEELLGSHDGKTDVERENIYEQLLADMLSAEKLAQLHELARKYFKLGEDLREQTGNMSKEEMGKRDAALQREMVQAMESLLTPEELAEFRLRSSPIANARQTFSGLLNEEEFRALAKSGVKVGDKADAASDDQVRNLIGPERFVEFKRVQNSDFLQLEKIARRCELPRETAVQAYEMKLAADAQVKRAQADKSLGPDQREELVRAIHAQSEKSIGEALGERAMKVYRQNGGEWIGK